MKKELAVSIVLVFALACAVQADIYGFTNITNNDPINAATGEAQMSVNVTEVSGRAQFEFSNAGPNPSRINMLAFESGGVLESFFSLVNGSGVLLVNDPAPGNLPGGNSLTPPFNEVFTDSRSGASANGVDPGESVTVTYNLASGASFADLISALNAGTLRVGIHVISFGYFPGDTVDRGSEAFVTGPPETPIPAPAASLLGAIGLTAVGLWQRRRMA